MDEKYSSFTKDLEEASTPIEIYAQKVLTEIIKDGVPPLPNYYRDYFYNMLENEPVEFKKHIYEMLSLEESNEFEKDFEYEKKIKISFKYTKELLQRVAIIYKNSTNFKNLLESHLKEIGHIATPKVLEKIISQLEQKLEQINKKLEKEQKAIKSLYSKNVEIIKEIESNSLFDAKFGVYNKRYFINLLSKEIKLIEQFRYVSSLASIKIKKDILDRLSERGRILVNRSLAKILLKTSRRTDTVAHFGDGVFLMFLKHTDRIGASKTIERVAEMVSNASIFLEGEEVELSIISGIVEIKEMQDVQYFIDKSLEAMKKAQKEGMLYFIYEGDI